MLVTVLRNRVSSSSSAECRPFGGRRVSAPRFYCPLQGRQANQPSKQLFVGDQKTVEKVEKEEANVMRDDQPEWRKHSKNNTEAPSRLGTGRLVGQGADESVDVGAFEGHRWGWCSCPRPR